MEAERVAEANRKRVEAQKKKEAQRKLIIESMAAATASFVNFNRNAAKGSGNQSEKVLFKETQCMQLETIVDIPEEEEDNEASTDEK